MSVSSVKGVTGSLSSVMGEFKTFILRGNVVDLAVGFVIGVAFTAVVNALVKDIITPIIAAIFGQPDFSSISFTINNSVFLIGDFINAVISFLVVAFAIFLVVKPLNMLAARRKTEVAVGTVTAACPYCLSDVPMAATRCAFCTSELKPTPA